MARSRARAFILELSSDRLRAVEPQSHCGWPPEETSFNSKPDLAKGLKIPPRVRSRPPGETSMFRSLNLAAGISFGGATGPFNKNQLCCSFIAHRHNFSMAMASLVFPIVNYQRIR
jgi:hypothetical protein